MRRAIDFLDKLYSDLEGPFPPGIHGEKYMWTVTDDSTGTTWTEPLVSKDETFEKTVDWVTRMETQLGRKVKVWRTDLGTEFYNYRFSAYFAKKGIQWEHSAAYTHAQNGKAERKNYTLMGPTRSIMAEKHLGKHLWYEIVSAVCHVRNRCPTRVLDNNAVPYFALNGEMPDVSHFKVLGSRAWVLIPKTILRGKLDERSWQGIFVGYEGTNYRIYNPKTGKVTAHRDVKIDEDAVYQPGESEITLFPWTEQDDLLLTGLEYEDSLSLIIPTTDFPSAESSDLSLLPSGEPSSDEASEEDNEPLPRKKPCNPKNRIPDGFKPRDSTRSKGTKFREYYANFLDTVVRLFGDDDILKGLTPKSYIYMVKVFSALSKGETLDPKPQEP